MIICKMYTDQLDKARVRIFLWELLRLFHKYISDSLNIGHPIILLNDYLVLLSIYL